MCLNVGCIPSKALIKNAERAHLLTHDKAKFGIEGDVTMYYGPTHKRSRQLSDGIVKGVHFLMKKNKIEEIDGWGTLTGAKSMTVALNHGQQREITFDYLILAAGAATRMLPGVEVSENVVTYEEQILVAALPGFIIIATTRPNRSQVYSERHVAEGQARCSDSRMETPFFVDARPLLPRSARSGERTSGAP